MKGCPLKCKWCHNPEGLSGSAQLRFFEEKCIGCGLCGTRTRLSDAQFCPARALAVCGEEMTDDEIVLEILKDRDFYADNGGVTFSGGECLLQADLVTAVLRRIKEHGIHTAIDTSGYVPWSEIEKTLKHCELYLYDIKCIDPDLHREYTGVHNALILDNFKRLSTAGRDVWVRVPIIPGFNNSRAETEAIAGFVSSVREGARVTLIPYNTLGVGKYKSLSMDYTYPTDKLVSDGELSEFKRIFESHGLTVE